MTLKVLTLDHNLLTNVGYWRFYMPFKAVKDMYRNAVVNFEFDFTNKNLNYVNAWESDIVIVPRPGSKPDMIEFIEKAKDNGAKIVVDLDDHIMGLPDCHQLYSNYKKGSEHYQRALKIFDLADMFWFSVPKFLETYEPYFKDKPALVVPNAIPPEWLPKKPMPDFGLWSWRGRDIQVHDLIYAGADWYIKNRRKAKKWMFIGWKPPLAHVDNVAEPIPYQDDPQVYLKNLRQKGLNGIWKPMMKIPFNDHKSNIAWIEATMAGGACITNYAGEGEWKYSTKDFPTYQKACELWEKSKQQIIENYNLYQTAKLRAEAMAFLCSHLLPTSPGTATTSEGQIQPTQPG